MANEVIAYLEMCQREGSSLQRGMNYRLDRKYSVILMSLRPNAPYQDRTEDDGAIIYEGHDVPKSAKCPNPKLVDQPECFSSGVLTQNGKFYQAAIAYKQGFRSPERVRVYEKIRGGIWSYNGLFQLVDAWQESDGTRLVFRFKLEAIEEQEDNPETTQSEPSQHRRIIPTSIKLEVWKRDGGKCAICGATDELHFDHVIPWSKGGTSLKAENIQLLCARHNLEKRDKII